MNVKVFVSPAPNGHMVPFHRRKGDGGERDITSRPSRQIEGELHTMSGRYEVGGVAFDRWEIESLEDVT
jgi:hypothetical protein